MYEINDHIIEGTHFASLKPYSYSYLNNNHYNYVIHLFHFCNIMPLFGLFLLIMGLREGKEEMVVLLLLLEVLCFVAEVGWPVVVG